MQSTSASECHNSTTTDDDHSGFTYQELRRMFLKIVSYEFDVDICKEAFIQCMKDNVNRSNFSQEALKRAILMTPKSYARNVMCNDHPH